MVRSATCDTVSKVHTACAVCRMLVKFEVKAFLMKGSVWAEQL